jgi:hypothetical protein|nr:MAG TPA: hypothetical protein [Caudoviricetes sp.]
MRLIDADKLIKEIVNTPTRYVDDGIDARCGIAHRQSEIIDIIDKQPIMAQWRKLIFRPLTDEEKEFYPECTEFIKNLPDYNEDVLVTDGISVWVDSFDMDEGVYLSGTDYDIDGVVAWMEIPGPYEEEQQ